MTYPLPIPRRRSRSMSDERSIPLRRASLSSAAFISRESFTVMRALSSGRRPMNQSYNGRTKFQELSCVTGISCVRY